jgi:hypothetical protein
LKTYAQVGVGLMLEKSSLDNSTYIVEIVQGFGADRYGFWFADIYSITMSTSLMFVSPSQQISATENDVQHVRVDF